MNQEVNTPKTTTTILKMKEKVTLSNHAANRRVVQKVRHRYWITSEEILQDSQKRERSIRSSVVKKKLKEFHRFFHAEKRTIQFLSANPGLVKQRSLKVLHCASFNEK